MANELENNHKYEPKKGGKSWKDRYTPHDFPGIDKIELNKNWEDNVSSMLKPFILQEK